MSNQPQTTSAWKTAALVVLGTAAIMLPDLAFATGADTPMGSILCRIVGFFTGNTGKALATIAVTVIGIGALMGKVSWGMAILVGVGVGVLFGAAGIVNAVGNVSGGSGSGAYNVTTQGCTST